MTDSLRDKLRTLAVRGTGMDLNPTRLHMDPDADTWWCSYLSRLDNQWRARIVEILDAEQDETADACGRGPCWLSAGHDGDCQPGPGRPAPEGQPEGSERKCRHADSLYGRCADCGMTWEAQAKASAPAPVPDDARTPEHQREHMRSYEDGDDCSFCVPVPDDPQTPAAVTPDAQPAADHTDDAARGGHSAPQTVGTPATAAGSLPVPDDEVEALTAVLRAADKLDASADLPCGCGVTSAVWHYPCRAKAVLASDWLAAHDREVAAGAWDEGYCHGIADGQMPDGSVCAENPHRAQAIREGRA